jgi:hypothetical protein
MMRSYIEANGHGMVPVDYITKDGYCLGRWVHNIRKAYQLKRLSQKQQNVLDKLGGWEWEVVIKNENYERSDVRNHDRWFRGYEYLLEYIKRNHNSIVPTKYITKNGFKLGKWTQSQRASFSRGELSEKRQKILERVPGWYWNQGDVQWLKGLEYLLQYIKRNGNTLVPRRHIEEDGYKLGQWVMSQRERYKQKKLSAKRRRILEGLPLWTWRLPKGRRNLLLSTKGWTKSLERLREYVKHEGHACVPSGYITEGGYKLGTWVRDQRHLKKKGELSEEKQNTLNELQGWVWVGKRSPTDLTWEEAYKLLKEFCENEGHARVHQHYKTEDNYGLGAWVGIQRAIYKNDKLSKKKQELLEKLPGWVWDARKDYWPKGYKYLCNYAKNYGTSRVQYDYTTEDGYNLGTWVVTQRTWKRKGLLTTERQKKLEKFPDWTWGGSRRISQSWQESLSSLIEYAKEHGNSKVPHNYITNDGFSLGRWVIQQRYLYKKNKLSPGRIEALEELPGWTWGKESRKSWPKAYEYLKQYAEVNGHPRVPINVVTDDGYRLGKWVDNQRYLYKKGRLTLERQKALEQIRNWSWAGRREQ